MKTALLFTLIGLQVAWLVGTTAYQETLLARADTVVLATRPVDPRDFLRGDYVVLSYEISRLPLRLFMNPPRYPKEAGAEVYVILEKQGECHAAVAASMQPFPALKPGQRLIRGRLDARRLGVSGPDVSVLYGIERYYVPEGKGNLRGRVTVEVALPSSGIPAIKQLSLDGKPFSPN